MAEALARAGLAHDVVLTTRAGEAAELAGAAVADGVRLVVAVGGDGTLHELVNGVLGDADRAPDGVMVGLVPAGRGSDYARGLALDARPEVLVARFAAALDGDPAAVRRVDAGELTYAPTALVAGRPVEPASRLDGAAVRRFVNEAGFGFSTYVAQRTTRFPPALGAWLYTVAGVVTIIDWRHRALELTWDDGMTETRRIATVELALGRFAGGGMLVAPDADPADGLFDVMIVGEPGRLELLTFSWRIRSGDHLRSPRVSVRRTARLDARVVDDGGPVYVQADGELLGREPFAARLLPGALAFVG